MTSTHELTHQNSTNVRSHGAPPLRLRLLRTGFATLSRVSPSAAALAAERLFLTPRRHARPQRERELLERAGSFTFETQYGPLHAWEWGTHGERVLLVHGWEGRGAQLGELVPPLLARGLRVITFDAPAHGDSPGSLSSFFHFAHSIELAARRFAPLRAIVTHSMGGGSLTWASRSGELAERLVMIAPPADVRDFTEPLSLGLGLEPAAVRKVEQRLARRFGVALDEVQTTRLAPQMTAPLLVIHDEDDRQVPIRSGELVASSWPGAKLLRTRGLGHRRILRDPDAIHAVLDFVKR